VTNAHRSPARRTADRGAAAVEMALVMPLLLLMVFGIIDFGRMLNAQIALTEAAREGARVVALGYDDSAVNAVVSTSTPRFTPAVQSEVVSRCDGEPEPGALGGAGDVARVRLTHQYEAVTPLGAITKIFGGDEDGSVPLDAEGVMPCLGSG